MRAIPFSEIPEQGLELMLRGLEVGEAAGAAAEGGVDADLRLDHAPGGRVLVRGRVRFRARLCCDRCLDFFRVEIDQEFGLVLEPGAGAGEPGGEYRLGPDELDVEFVAAPEADPAAIVAQQFLLALPVKRLCRADCPGICPGCGRELKSGGCRCPEEGNGPFAALAALLDPGGRKDG